jgi:hypothetical protein
MPGLHSTLVHVYLNCISLLLRVWTKEKSCSQLLIWPSCIALSGTKWFLFAQQDDIITTWIYTCFRLPLVRTEMALESLVYLRILYLLFGFSVLVRIMNTVLSGLKMLRQLLCFGRAKVGRRHWIFTFSVRSYFYNCCL